MIKHEHDWSHGVTVGDGDELQVCRQTACGVMRVQLSNGKQVLISPNDYPGNMSPDRHYIEAEKLLESAATGTMTGDAEHRGLVAEALVHATLATYRPNK